jgi:ABC-2 type transport system ATP-binding protein
MQTPAVELSDLEKTFRTSKDLVRAVRGVDLTIHAGEVVALLGPNGAGKSTTIDLLRRSAAGSGCRRFDRRDAPERIAHSHLSVREPLAMMAAVYPAPLDVDVVVALAGIDGIARRRTQKLSGGETQRVRFALALVADPDLLVLDEPTVALDVESRRVSWRTVRSFAGDGAGRSRSSAS